VKCFISNTIVTVRLTLKRIFWLPSLDGIQDRDTIWLTNRLVNNQITVVSKASSR